MARRNFTILYFESGYTFNLSYTKRWGGGVIIHSTHDLSDPKLIEALRTVQGDYERLEPYCDLCEMLRERNDKSFAELTWRDLRVMKRLLKKAIASGVNLKSEDVQKFIKWVREKYPIEFPEDYQDVFNKAYSKYLKDRHADRSGYVYLLQSTTGFYKIGRTDSPKTRISHLRITLPFEVEYTCLIKTEDMFTLERDLHNKYTDLRRSGEWFALSPEDVEYIKGLAS